MTCVNGPTGRVFTAALLPRAATGLLLLALSLMVTMPTAMAAADDQAPVSVEVTFSNFLTRYLSSLDRIERIREERFRGTRSGRRILRNTRSFLGASRFEGFDWASESLIPELDDFSVERLVRQLTRQNLQAAVPDFKGSVRYRIDRIHVHGHSLAVLRGGGTYVSGQVTIREEDGHILLHKILTANLVVDPTQSADAAKDAFAFAETDESDRVGPALAYFVEQALEAAWPDKAKEIRGPVIVRLTRPGERLFETMPR